MNKTEQETPSFFFEETIKFRPHIVYIYNVRSKIDSFLRKGCFLFCFCLRRTAYVVRDNAKKFTSVGLSYKDVILFSKIFYVFDVVYVKSNSI